MSEYQEEVLTNLLDLQAELRGDEAEPHDEESPAPGQHDAVTVTEPGVAVSVPEPARSTMTVNERLVALNERLGHLEHDLARITKRIERIEPDAEAEPHQDPDPDAPWRSFLDLQKIVADRLDH